MEEDRPGSSDSEDNTEQEEVPSTSGVQEQAPGGDENILVMEVSESSSEDEAEEESSESARRGTKRKRADDTTGGAAPEQPVSATQQLAPTRAPVIQIYPLSLRAVIHAIGNTSTNPNLRAIDMFFGSQLPSTSVFLAHAMAIRQAIRDCRGIPCSRKCQATWKLATPAASWPMGFRRYASWMHSYTDDNVDNPIPIMLRVTIACEEGERCHVSFSSGLFKPPRVNNADYQWLVVQHRVGDIVQSCDPIYRPLFDYVAIFRNLRYIWDNVLAPEQRIPFMVFLGYLQRSENIYLMRFIDDALRTTRVETPWINEQPGLAVRQGWTSALLRGRVLDREAIGTGEPRDDVIGETRSDSEDTDSGGDEPENIPRIVSRTEPKNKRPYVFLMRGHRLALLRTGDKTLEARKARAVASGRLTEDSVLALAQPPHTGGSAEKGSQKGRRKALQPEPAPSPLEMQELAHMYRLQHEGTGGTSDQPAPAPRPAVQELPVPTPSPRPAVQELPVPSPPLGAGEQRPSIQAPQEPVRIQEPALAGPFVRPWEAAAAHAPLGAPLPVRPQPVVASPYTLRAPGMNPYVPQGPSPITSTMAQTSTWAADMSQIQGSQATAVARPLRPVARRATLPGVSFGGEGMVHFPRPHQALSSGHLPVEAPQEPSGSHMQYPVVRPGGRHAPRVRRAPITWQTSPYLTPTSTPVRVRLALMRSRAQGRPTPLGSVEHQALGFPAQRPTASHWQLVPEQQMYYGGHSSQGTGLTPAPTMTPAPPRYFEPPVQQPVRPQVLEAYGLAQPAAATQWPPVSEFQRPPGSYGSQGASPVQIPTSTPAVPLYGAAPAYSPAGPGAPLSPAVTQYHLSQAALGTDADDEGTGDSDSSELCEALDLSIHGRPRPRTPESMIVRPGDGQTDESTRMVLVSAMVHLGQGAELPDLEDPPDDV